MEVGADTEAALPNIGRSLHSRAAGSPCTCQSCSSCRTASQKTCPGRACGRSNCSAGTCCIEITESVSAKQHEVSSTHPFALIIDHPNTCAKRARAVSEDGWKTACTALFLARTDADRYRSDTLESTSPHGPANGAFSRAKKMLYAAEEKRRQRQKRATFCC